MKIYYIATPFMLYTYIILHKMATIYLNHSPYISNLELVTDHGVMYVKLIIWWILTGRQSETANPPPAPPALDNPSDCPVLLSHCRAFPPPSCTELPLARSAEAGVGDQYQSSLRKKKWERWIIRRKLIVVVSVTLFCFFMSIIINESLYIAGC